MKHIKPIVALTEESKKGPAGYSLNIQHEYITLRTPYGNYTTSYRGEKLSGRLTTIDGLLMRLYNYTKEKAKGSTFGAAMEALMDNFETIVPEVKNLPETEKFEVDDVVTIKDDAAYSSIKKKYPKEYPIRRIEKKYAYIELPTGQRMGLDMDWLIGTGKKDKIERYDPQVGDFIKFTGAASKDFPNKLEIKSIQGNGKNQFAIVSDKITGKSVRLPLDGRVAFKKA